MQLTEPYQKLSIKLINAEKIVKMYFIPFLTFASLCPIYIFRSSGPLIDKKLYIYSVATALANSVFPVPGGPYNNMPRFQININLSFKI